MGLTRSIGPRAIRHANVGSKVHAEDVKENNFRRSLYWVAAQQEVADGHRIIPTLGEGIYMVRDIGQNQFEEVSGDLQTEVLTKWRAELAWYLREVEFPDTRKGAQPGAKRKRLMKTRTKGIQAIVVTLPPHYSKTIFEKAETPEGAEEVRQWCRENCLGLATELERRACRRVLAISTHFDAKNLHFHVYFTRVGPDHRFIAGSHKRIGLVGDWCVGVLRQQAYGVLPPSATNVVVANRLADRNRQRTGDIPVDWAMAKFIDAACYTFLGTSPRATAWLRIYKSGVIQSAVGALLEAAKACTVEAERLGGSGGGGGVRQELAAAGVLQSGLPPVASDDLA
jgi:hypothetical protein